MHTAQAHTPTIGPCMPDVTKIICCCRCCSCCLWNISMVRCFFCCWNFVYFSVFYVCVALHRLHNSIIWSCVLDALYLVKHMWIDNKYIREDQITDLFFPCNRHLFDDSTRSEMLNGVLGMVFFVRFVPFSPSECIRKCSTLIIKCKQLGCVCAYLWLFFD